MKTLEKNFTIKTKKKLVQVHKLKRIKKKKNDEEITSYSVSVFHDHFALFLLSTFVKGKTIYS